MRNGSIRVGSVRGIPIHLHWSVVLIVVLLGTGALRELGPVVTAITIVAFMASILAHEVAHALVARHYGVGTESIQLWALGGMAELDREAPTPRAEGMIAASGPLTSLGIGAAGVGVAFLLVAAGAHGATLHAVAWIGAMNVLLGVFNLLPGAPLDGGRVVRALRWRRHGDKYRASREAADVGKAIGWSIAGVGAVLLYDGHPGLMVLLTGLFIAVSASAQARAADTAERLDGVHVRDLTWFGIAHASTDTDAGTILWQRSRLGAAGVVAVEDVNGKLAGLVTEAQLLALPEPMRARVRLSSLMVPFSSLAQAGPDEDLSSVLSRIDPRRPLLTVWDHGELLGVVTERRLLARLRRP